jgi:small subunit ribosomal protein S6
MLILPPEADDAGVGGVTDRIAQVVAEGRGKVVNVDRWGKRRLAYEIDRHSEGYYVVAECVADPAAMGELDRVLSLADQVMRFKVVVRGEAEAASAPAAAAPTVAEAPSVLEVAPQATGS